jgi:hypothetical protein
LGAGAFDAKSGISGLTKEKSVFINLEVGGVSGAGGINGRGERGEWFAIKVVVGNKTL